jgi:hypothetical protein
MRVSIGQGMARVLRMAATLGFSAGLAAVSSRAQAPAPPVPARPAASAATDNPEALDGQLLGVRRIFVDRLTGGETAAQMRDLVIASLHSARLFILTENAERADASLRGAAEDLIYTDVHQSSDGINAHLGEGDHESTGTSTRFNGASGGASRSSGRNLAVGIGENESNSSHERMHEAIATVRIVNKDGDVIWSTTQESNGAKYRGASADVADKIMHQLVNDVERLRKTGGISKN